MNLVIMGPIGSGKGTQAGIISKKLGIPHISTGDIMRKHIKDETDIGLKIKQKLETGSYVDDTLTSEILKSRIFKDDVKNGFILDGFPRTINQANILSEMVAIDKVIFLNVDNDIVIDRISSRLTCEECGAMYSKSSAIQKCEKCGGNLSQRKDDKKEVVENRLEIFEKETLPILNFYKSLNLLVEINGMLEIDVVTDIILKELVI
ncbi:MAG: adenylate kinase [Defluviitaleaceae bacterium]|nr:adenylate kinase [Defluviitaleaceae bacterium]